MRNRWTSRGPAIVLAVTAISIVGCTAHSGNGAPGPSPAPTQTTIETITKPPPANAQRPVDTGPTRAATASACPLVGESAAANRVGMRLDRIVVLTTRGRVRGCRIYALQHSPLSESEHLPGPHQPAVEITSQTYRSVRAAHNAVVRLADAGHAQQRVHITASLVGACFQTAFYRHDHGRDWSCAYAHGRVTVLVRTVVVSPALDAVAVARMVAAHL